MKEVPFAPSKRGWMLEAARNYSITLTIKQDSSVTTSSDFSRRKATSFILEEGIFTYKNLFQKKLIKIITIIQIIIPAHAV
jgi:hypothetical protein